MQEKFTVGHQINRLEQVLRLWEDVCFFFRTTHRFKEQTGNRTNTNALCPQIGPILHWQSFRGQLLKACKSPASLNLERYCSLGQLREHLSQLALLPVFLWLWTQCSRRVYHMTAELQLLLRATMLDRVSWDEVRLPFDSFAIQLDDPITDPKSGKQYDVILVSRTELEGPRINFLLLNKQLESYESPTQNQRQQLDNAFAKGHWPRIADRLNQINGKHVRCSCVEISVRLADAHSVSIEEVGGMKEEEAIDATALFTQTARIVVGLCLYLRTLPLTSPYQSDWTPSNKTIGRPDPTCIINEALICTVSSSHKLTAAEYEVIIEGRSGPRGYEMRAHFRCGHWRRPPGSGSDPTVEKTVWVRPCLVRRDRLPPDGIPGGSETVLS